MRDGLQDYGLQIARHARIDHPWRKQLAGRIPGEGILSCDTRPKCQQFVQGETEGVDVTPGIRASLESFGSDLTALDVKFGRIFQEFFSEKCRLMSLQVLCHSIESSSLPD